MVEDEARLIRKLFSTEVRFVHRAHIQCNRTTTMASPPSMPFTPPKHRKRRSNAGLIAQIGGGIREHAISNRRVNTDEGAGLFDVDVGGVFFERRPQDREIDGEG